MENSHTPEQLAEAIKIITPHLEASIRQDIKKLQSVKKRMILELLGTRNYEHPDFSEVNFQDEKSIHIFLAKENIKCVLICDPFQPVEQLYMLCRIIKNDYDSRKEYPHISIFNGYDASKLRNDSTEDLVTYFKIHLKDMPQGKEEIIKNIEELKQVILSKK